MTITVRLPYGRGSETKTINLPRAQSVTVQEILQVSVLDTQGNVVPVHKPHSFTYDGSGNLATDTVSDGGKTWVRTYGWMGGAQTSDSGWVKQNG